MHPPRVAAEVLPVLSAIRGGALAALTIATMQTPLIAQQAGERAEVFEASILELHEATVTGATTSVALVDAYLARIEAYDKQGPALNAILRVNPRAREEAAALDRELAERGPRGPLHGIPIILKDNYDTRDLPTTGGSIALATHQPATDAFQVARLREAGAVILAKSNLHELAYGITTISSLGGQTRNPYDPTRNPGGSSGGTGAAIAASFAAVGWGSDTCGSIRIPAAVNGLFGLRPTKGLSSIAGILPLSHSQDTGGPLARSITDLAIALDATVGPDPADPATAVMLGRPQPRFAEALDAGALRGARIGVLRQYFGDGPDERETGGVVSAALEEMARHGAVVEEVQIPELEQLLSGTSLIDYEFKWDLLDYLARSPDPPVTSLSEILERGLHHEAVANILRRSDRHETRQPEGLPEVIRKREALVAVVDSVLMAGGFDALAYPSIRREAALIGEAAIGSNCQLSAATGMPALTVPAGVSERGIPVGLELLGRRFADERLVAIGYSYEQASAPRRPPPFTPPLVDGIAPRPMAFAVQVPIRPATTDQPLRAEFTYDPVTGALSYEIAVDSAAADSVQAAVLRRGSDGPILYRLVAPGQLRASGKRALSPTQRDELAAGELTLQVFMEDRAGPAGQAVLRLPQ